MARYAISQPVTQVEAPRLLKGKGRYTSDVFLDRVCHAYFLRSPHAHADIVSIDTTAAKAMPPANSSARERDFSRCSTATKKV